MKQNCVTTILTLLYFMPRMNNLNSNNAYCEKRKMNMWEFHFRFYSRKPHFHLRKKREKLSYLFMHQSSKFQWRKKTFNENNTRIFIHTDIHTCASYTKHYITISSLLLLWLELLAGWLAGWLGGGGDDDDICMPCLVFQTIKKTDLSFCDFFFFFSAAVIVFCSICSMQ